MLNHFLSLIGLDVGAIAWLGQANTALIAVAIPMVWKYLGLYIILFLAAIQEIPQSIVDAARIDGAGRWREFRHVVLPLLRPTIAECNFYLRKVANRRRTIPSNRSASHLYIPSWI